MKSKILSGVAILLFLRLTIAQAQSASPLTVIGITGSAGAAHNQFDNPTSVFVDTDGKVFVTDKNNNRISVWTQNGNTFSPLATFGGFGIGTTELNTPTSVFKASNNYVYVTDGSNNRISVWTQSGNAFGNLTTFGDGTFFNNPISTKVASDGKIYVVDNYNNRISVWTLSGGVFGNLTSFGTLGSAINELNQPTDISFTTDGKILVADASNNRISVWTNTGNVFSALTTFGGTGAGASQLSSPWGITVAPDNKVYIADLSNQRISIWTTSGIAFGNVTFLGTSGTSGSGNNQFSDPSGVFVTASNKIFVADLYNHRVSVWETCSAPQITHQPTSQTICGSNAATFGVTATGTSLTYTWWNANNGAQSLATTVGFSTSVAGSYFALATGACGSVYSDVITLTSNPVTAISNQPSSQSICGNIAAILGVTATGANLSYLWSNGATTQTIQTSVSGSYMVTVTGICGTVASSSATLTNAGNSTQIITQPSSQTLCAGNLATFGVTATGSSLVYLWNNGANTQTIQTSVAGSYIVTVSGTCGNTVSNSAQLTATPRTSITSITSGVAVAQGSKANLNVLATGTQLNYIWSNGATTATVPNVDPGEYFVTVSGSCGTVINSAFIGNIVLASSNSGYTYQGSFGNSGSGADQFANPYGITIASDGRVYIVDSKNSRISVWQKSGNNYTHITNFGSIGNMVNELFQPFGIAVSSDGNTIYITDTNNSRVSVWQKSGNNYTHFANFNGVGVPIGITVTSDRRIYVVDGKSSFFGYLAFEGNHRVTVWTQSGSNFNNIATFGSKGNTSDKFNSPYGITVSNDGKIYVAEGSNHRISVWQKNGNTYNALTTFGTNGRGINQLNNPIAVKLSSDGKIYVTDYGNHRISVWSQSGNNFSNITTFGSYGSKNDSLKAPQDMFVIDKDNFLISDTQNDRISIWKAPAPIFYWQATFDITAPTTFTGITATLTWPTIPGLANVRYCLRISKDKSFGGGVKTVCGITGNSYTYNPNDPNGRTEAGLEEYFWQVAGQDSAGNLSQWSEVQSFSLDATATSTNSSIYQPTNVSIYPNPSANGEFRMENGEYVTITDVVGKEILSTTKSTFTIASKGIFIARVKTKFGITTLKLVVE